MILFNSQLYSSDDATVRLYNRSFKYGDALFETIRIFKGTVLFWGAHLNRLFAGMIALKYEFEQQAFTQILNTSVEEIFSQNEGVSHGKLRLHVFRAGNGTYLPSERKPQFLIEITPIPKDYFEFPHSMTLSIYKDHSLHYSLLSAFKTANSLPYIMGAMDAADKGFDDSVMICDGFVSETTSANLFVVADNGHIFTPPLHHGCLPGIMRQQIIQLGKTLNLPFFEKELREKDLKASKEIFVTNSISGISTVSKFKEFEKSEKFGKNLQNEFLDHLLNKII